MIDIVNILTLTQKEIRDARNNRWYVLYTVVFTALSLLLAWLGLAGLGNYGLAGFGRTAASIVNMVLLIVPLMGLTLGALSLSGERERGTLLYILSQPVSHIELLLGKYIGLAIALFSALVFGFGLSGLLITWRGGNAELGVYLLLVVFTFLLALVTLSLGFLISSAVKKGATAISLALFVWLLLVLFGDLGLMGTSLVLKLEAGELFTLALLNPVHLFKIAAVFNIRNSLEILGPAGMYAFRTYGNQLVPFLIGILVIWAIVPLVIAQTIFRKRGVV